MDVYDERLCTEWASLTDASTCVAPLTDLARIGQNRMVCVESLTSRVYLTGPATFAAALITRITCAIPLTGWVSMGAFSATSGVKSFSSCA